MAWSASDVGKGMSSGTRQICAETLGIAVEDVSVEPADGDSGPHCMGSFASRGTHRVGNAVMAAAREARGVMMEAAAEELEVSPDELELMRSYAATPRAIFWRIRVPHALPFFFSALKVVSVLSIVFAIVAEYFGGPQDVLGQYLLHKASLFVYPDAWAGILVASILGLALYGIVIVTERLVMPWHVSLRDSDSA